MVNQLSALNKMVTQHQVNQKSTDTQTMTEKPVFNITNTNDSPISFTAGSQYQGKLDDDCDLNRLKKAATYVDRENAMNCIVTYGSLGEKKELVNYLVSGDFPDNDLVIEGLISLADQGDPDLNVLIADKVEDVPYTYTNNQGDTDLIEKYPDLLNQLATDQNMLVRQQLSETMLFGKLYNDVNRAFYKEGDETGVGTEVLKTLMQDESPQVRFQSFFWVSNLDSNFAPNKTIADELIPASKHNFDPDKYTKEEYLNALLETAEYNFLPRVIKTNLLRSLLPQGLANRASMKRSDMIAYLKTPEAEQAVSKQAILDVLNETHRCNLTEKFGLLIDITKQKNKDFINEALHSTNVNEQRAQSMPFQIYLEIMLMIQNTNHT